MKPAYDCIGVQPCVHGSPTCKPGTGGSHGRHNAELHMTVRGADAEVALIISTGWDLPTVPAHQRCIRHLDYPRGAFVEIHTARPRYEGQGRREPQPGDSCFGWPGCYVDTGFTMSDQPTRLLVEKGSDATWEWLESLYARTQAAFTGVEPSQAEAIPVDTDDDADPYYEWQEDMSHLPAPQRITYGQWLKDELLAARKGNTSV